MSANAYLWRVCKSKTSCLIAVEALTKIRPQHLLCRPWESCTIGFSAVFLLMGTCWHVDSWARTLSILNPQCGLVNFWLQTSMLVCTCGWCKTMWKWWPTTQPVNNLSTVIGSFFFISNFWFCISEELYIFFTNDIRPVIVKNILNLICLYM